MSSPTIGRLFLRPMLFAKIDEVPKGFGTSENPIRLSLVACLRYTSVGDGAFHRTPIAMELLNSGSACDAAGSVVPDISDHSLRLFQP